MFCQQLQYALIGTSQKISNASANISSLGYVALANAFWESTIETNACPLGNVYLLITVAIASAMFIELSLHHHCFGKLNVHTNITFSILFSHSTA